MEMHAHDSLGILLGRNNGPDSDEVVAESTKEGLTVGGPGEGEALRALRLGVVTGDIGRIGSEVVDNGSEQKC